MHLAFLLLKYKKRKSDTNKDKYGVKREWSSKYYMILLNYL